MLQISTNSSHIIYFFYFPERSCFIAPIILAAPSLQRIQSALFALTGGAGTCAHLQVHLHSAFLFDVTSANLL